MEAVSPYPVRAGDLGVDGVVVGERCHRLVEGGVEHCDVRHVGVLCDRPLMPARLAGL